MTESALPAAAAETAIRVEVATSLEGIPPAAWDALTGGDNPFVEHRFLRLLESSGSVGERAGWLPAHILAFANNRLVAALPTYIKSHSMGEYVFDWAWAEAAERAGLSYYPKLVAAVPFTPATGPRLLLNPELDRDPLRLLLVDGLERLVRDVGASGAHVLLPDEEEATWLGERGFWERHTLQFHWHNRGYRSFTDYLDSFRSPARKQVRRERQKVRDAGVEVTLHRGDELSLRDWNTLFALYRATGARKWGSPYLTADFFEAAGPQLGDRAVVLFARHHGEVVAGSLSFRKGRHLYGRYWGAFQPFDCLHFELCYYRLIEHAIDQGIVLFEAGAQGEHKLRRGFEPVAVRSSHRLVHPGLNQAVGKFVAQEREQTAAAIGALRQHSPFRRGSA